MAQVSITHTWPGDGGETELMVYAEDSYPDALDQAVSSALRLWRETCTETAES